MGVGPNKRVHSIAAKRKTIAQPIRDLPALAPFLTVTLVPAIAKGESNRGGVSRNPAIGYMLVGGRAFLSPPTQQARARLAGCEWLASLIVPSASASWVAFVDEATVGDRL